MPAPAAARVRMWVCMYEGRKQKQEGMKSYASLPLTPLTQPKGRRRARIDCGGAETHLLRKEE